MQGEKHKVTRLTVEAVVCPQVAGSPGPLMELATLGAGRCMPASTSSKNPPGATKHITIMHVCKHSKPRTNS
jgi:hypothetical protein